MNQITETNKIKYFDTDFSYTKFYWNKQPSSNNLFTSTSQKILYLSLSILAGLSESLFKLASYPLNLGLKVIHLIQSKFSLQKESKIDIQPVPIELLPNKAREDAPNSNTIPPVIHVKPSPNKSASSEKPSAALQNPTIEDKLELSSSEVVAATSTAVLLAAGYIKGGLSPFNFNPVLLAFPYSGLSPFNFLGTLLIARVIRTVAACFMCANRLRGKADAKLVLAASLGPVISPRLTALSITGASLAKLVKCVKNVTTQPVKALSHGLVHTFNTGTGMLELLYSGASANLVSAAQQIKKHRSLYIWASRLINGSPLPPNLEPLKDLLEEFVKDDIEDLLKLP